MPRLFVFIMGAVLLGFCPCARADDQIGEDPLPSWPAQQFIECDKDAGECEEVQRNETRSSKQAHNSH